MTLSSVKSDEDFERYLAEKELESHIEVSDEMGLGECVDENGMETTPAMWYWRGVSPEMNEGIE